MTIDELLEKHDIKHGIENDEARLEEFKAELILETHNKMCGFCFHEGSEDTKASDEGRGCAA